MSHTVHIAVDLYRTLSEQEQAFFFDELDEWLFDAFQDWPDNPFGDLRIEFPRK